jgi:hypothetical protein
VDRNGLGCGFISGRCFFYHGKLRLFVLIELLGSRSLKAVQVIMTQGLMYGFSSGLLFAPCISFVDEWFFQRRGLANGIL